MPTPYSHLWIAHRLLADEALSSEVQSAIAADVPAYLLGSIVADARIYPGADRELTHFYRYDKPMPDHPWQEMLRQNPTLAQPQTDSHRAFIAGYVAHLAADEYWTRQMVGPHFAEGAWGNDIRWRFYVLHLLLTSMDERDEARLQRRSHGRAVEQLCDHGKIRLGERQPGHGRCLQREPQRRQQEGETGETGHHCYHRQMPLYRPAAAGRIEREQRQAEQQAEIDVERPADGDECHVVHGVT